jgi:hypothetical protein
MFNPQFLTHGMFHPKHSVLTQRILTQTNILATNLFIILSLMNKVFYKRGANCIFTCVFPVDFLQFGLMYMHFMQRTGSQTLYPHAQG